MKTFLKYFLVFELFASCAAIAPEEQPTEINQVDQDSADIEQVQPAQTGSKIRAFFKKPVGKKTAAALAIAGGCMMLTAYVAALSNHASLMSNRIQYQQPVSYSVGFFDSLRDLKDIIQTFGPRHQQARHDAWIQSPQGQQMLQIQQHNQNLYRQNDKWLALFVGGYVSLIGGALGRAFGIERPKIAAQKLPKPDLAEEVHENAAEEASEEK